MTENIENLILEHLRALRPGQDRLEKALELIRMRVSSLEEHVSGLRKDVALVHSDIAVIHIRLDHQEERLGRIERRLELKEAV